MKFVPFQTSRREVGTVAQRRQAIPILLALLNKGHLVHRLGLSLLLIAFCCPAALGAGTTQIVDARIAQISARGFILQVGSDSISVDDTGSTRFWRAKAAAKRDAFKEGDLVTA